MSDCGAEVMVYLGIGSNIDAENQVANSKLALEKSFTHCRFSRVFESEAVGFEGDSFLNFVAEVKTDLTLELLMEKLKDLEDKLGRVRGGEKFSSRHIDIDILLFDQLVCETPIQLPRQEIVENAYVLWPLSELVPELKDPVTGELYQKLWVDFDKSKQSLNPTN